MTDQSDALADTSTGRSRTPSDRTARTRPDAMEEAPIALAAEWLGISTEAVRKRLQRGTLAGYKADDGGWMVVLERPDAASRPSVVASGRPDEVANRQPDVDRTPSETPGTVDLTPLATVIERQGEEIRRLAEAATLWQVRAVQAEERATHLQERLLALTAGETGQDAPVSRRDASGAADQADATAAPLTGFRQWWRRLWGST